MICYPDPCECFAKKVRTRAKKTAAPKQGSLPLDKEEGQTEPIGGGSGPAWEQLKESPAKAAMRAAAAKTKGEAGRRAMERFMEPLPPPRRVPVDQEQALLSSALRSLGDALHPTEQDRYKVILSSTPSVAERAAVWRGRHDYRE